MKGKRLLILSIIIDLVLIQVLPSSLNDRMISIVPSVYLVVLIISQKERHFIENLITCILFTTLYSIVVNQPILATNLIYLFLFIVSSIWIRFILNSIIEMVFLSISIIFMKELIIQMIRYFVYQGKIDILDILGYRIAPTTIFMVILSFSIVGIYQIIVDHYKVKQEMSKNHEKIKFFQYFNK